MNAVEKFVQCAKDQVGKPYRWATAGPDAFDCSGLVAFCYEQATGEAITRSSYEQANLGMWVPKSGMKAGDLVMWGHGQADHVGIFTGRDEFDGWVVNALNEHAGVVETTLDGNYGMPYLTSRRVFTERSIISLPIDPITPVTPSTNPRKEQRKRERDLRRRRRKA